MMISDTSWNFDEVYGYGEYPGKVLPSFVRSTNLNMQSCFNSLYSNLNLGMLFRCKKLTSSTESIANGPVNGHCIAITAWCQGSMQANRHGKKRLTFTGSGGRSHTREVLECTILWKTPSTGLLRVFNMIMVVSLNAVNAPTSILEVNVVGEK